MANSVKISVHWADEVRKVNTHVEKKIILILKGCLKGKRTPSSAFVASILVSNWAKGKLRSKTGEGIGKSKDFSLKNPMDERNLSVSLIKETNNN